MTAFAHLSGGFGSPLQGVVCPCAYRTKVAGGGSVVRHSQLGRRFFFECAYIMRARAARRFDLHWAPGRYFLCPHGKIAKGGNPWRNNGYCTAS